MNHIYYLGTAYAVVWIFIFLYVRRLTVNHKRLSERLRALESANAGHDDGR
jgi:CcmD family protein